MRITVNDNGGTSYDSFKTIVAAFGAVGPVFWFENATDGTGTVFLTYAVVDKGLSVVQWQTVKTDPRQPDPKPASFDADFPHAIQIFQELSPDAGGSISA